MQLRERIDARMPGLLDSAGIPGFGLAMIVRGRIVLERTFGVAIDSATVFEGASLSKPLLAYVALRLSDRGQLDLDRPLAGYLPLDELHDDRKSQITARMVLAHTTGLQNERIDSEALALAFDPGTRFRYSGEGYTYLGHVLEKVAGMSFTELMDRLAFRPLGMTRSAFVWEDRFDDNAATGHGPYGEARQAGRPGIARGAATLQTTLRDYALFLVALQLGTGLRPATRPLLGMPQVEVAPGIAWGLGWGFEQQSGGRAMWHHGDNSLSGFTALAWRSPANDTALVYFANSSTGLGIAAEVFRLTVGGTHPSVAWMDYEPYNAPSRLARLEIYRKLLAFGLDSGMTAYHRLSARWSPNQIPEAVLNSLGYRMLALQRASDAVALLGLNARMYPGSANVYDSLGDGYVAAGDQTRAVAAYKRSLALDPSNRHAAEAIRQIESR
jgi:CubicO group peptidase (beta-lactamase class C family)